MNEIDENEKIDEIDGLLNEVDSFGFEDLQDNLDEEPLLTAISNIWNSIQILAMKVFKGERIDMFLTKGRDSARKFALSIRLLKLRKAMDAPEAIKNMIRLYVEELVRDLKSNYSKENWLNFLRDSKIDEEK